MRAQLRQKSLNTYLYMAPCSRSIQLYTHTHTSTPVQTKSTYINTYIVLPFQTLSWLNRGQYERTLPRSIMKNCLGPVRRVTPISLPKISLKHAQTRTHTHTTRPSLALTVWDRGAFKEAR